MKIRVHQQLCANETLIVYLDAQELKPRVPRKSVRAHALTDVLKTMLNRAKLEFERRLTSYASEQVFEELQCENGKLTLTNREKGVVFLDLQEIP